MNILYRNRRGLFCCFLVLGFVMASWIVRTPSLRDTLLASTGVMGLVLFGFSLGSMSGILFAGQLIRRTGAAKCILYGLISSLIGLLTLASGTIVSSALIASIGLSLIGFGMAISEVAVNIIAVDVEHGLKRPVLTTVHGCYSMGTTLGATCGMLLVALQIPIALHMVLVCVLLAPALIYVVTNVKNPASVDHLSTERPQSLFQYVRQNPAIMLAGLIVLSVALAEGAANDWLPLLIVDSHNVPEKTGSLVFIVFALTMTVGRFCGSFFLRRYSPATVIRACGIICIMGISGVILAPNVMLATVAVILWALGAALGFPVAISAGAASGKNQTSSVNVLAITGYMAFLIGPPMLGFLGEHIGLKMAMVTVVCFLAFPVILAPVFGRKRKSSTEAVRH